MDDIIVIILTLLIAVAGILGQIKKKRKPGDNIESDQGTPDSIWDLFQEEQGTRGSVPEQEYEGYGYQQVKQPVVQEEIEEINEKGYKFSSGEEGKSVLSAKPPMERNKSTMPVSWVKKDFSLKKAVIFSEILNRKYN